KFVTCRVGTKWQVTNLPPQSNRRRPSRRMAVAGCFGGWLGKRSALGELEALAGAFAAVLLAFLHAAVAGKEAGVTQLLGHAAGGALLAVGGGRFGLRAEHVFDGPGQSLADGPGLPREAAALDVHDHVHAAAHLGHIERADDGSTVLVLGEVVLE